MKRLVGMAVVLFASAPSHAKPLRPLEELVKASRADPDDTRIPREIARHGTAEAARILVGLPQVETKPGAIRGALEALTDPEGAVHLHPLLEHPDRRLRRAAVDTLGRLASPESADVLLATLERDPEVEGPGLSALARCASSPEHLDAILSRLDGPRSRDAKRALARLQEPRLAPRVVPLLKAPDVGARRLAVSVLEALGNPETAAALLDTVEKDEDDKVRAAAAMAVATVASGKEVPRMLRILRRFRKENPRASRSRTELALLGALAEVDRVHGHRTTLKLLSGKDDATREVLGHLIRDARSVDEVVAEAGYRSREEYDRNLALRLYGAVGTPSARDRLCAVLLDEEVEGRLRAVAAEMLGRFSGNETVDCLIASFDRVPFYGRGKNRRKGTLGEDIARALRRVTGERIEDEDGPEWKKWWKYRVNDVDGAIETLSTSRDPGARSFAVSILLKAGAKDRDRVGQAMLATLETERNLANRVVLVKGLAQMQTPGAREAFALRLDEARDLEELEALAQALHDLGDGRGTLALIERLADETGPKAGAIGAALGRVSGEVPHASVPKWRAWWAANAERYRR